MVWCGSFESPSQVRRLCARNAGADYKRIGAQCLIVGVLTYKAKDYTFGMAQAVMIPQLPFPPGPKGNFFLGSARELARSWPGHSERCAREYGDVVCYRFLHVPICQLTH